MSTPILQSLATTPDNTTERPTNLHKFPLEMRLEVYKYMQPPFNCHVSDCRGLLLSNSEMYYEYSYETLKSINDYYEGIEKEWQRIYGTHLVISQQTTIGEVNNITVSIPNTFLRIDRQGSSPRFPEPLVALIPLSLSSITIEFYEDEKAKNGKVRADDVAGFVISLYQVMYEKPEIELDNRTTHKGFDRLGADRLQVNWRALQAPNVHVLVGFLLCECDGYRTVKYNTTINRDATWNNPIGITWDRM